MVQLIFFLQATQYRDCILDRRFADKHGLEPALKRGVFFDMLLIFVERCRADAVQFATRQGGLNQIGRVHRALAFACADQSVHFVDKKDDVALGLLHFVKHAFQPFFKLAAVFCARNQRTHVEREQLAMFQTVGHVAIGNAQGQSLSDSRFADARFSDQHRIILCPARQYLDRPADFFVSADDRIELTCTRDLSKVACKFLERVIAVFGTGSVCCASAAQFVNGPVQPFGVHPCGS